MGERAKVELIKEGVIQFDKSTGTTWYKKGEVLETPLTPFIYSRLGIYFRIVDVIKENQPKLEAKQPEPIKMEIENVEVEIVEEEIEPIKVEEIEKPKKKARRKTPTRKKK